MELKGRIESKIRIVWDGKRFRIEAELTRKEVTVLAVLVLYAIDPGLPSKIAQLLSTIF